MKQLVITVNMTLLNRWCQPTNHSTNHLQSTYIHAYLLKCVRKKKDQKRKSVFISDDLPMPIFSLPIKSHNQLKHQKFLSINNLYLLNSDSDTCHNVVAENH